MTRIYSWIDRNILELGRELRLSYLPPLMVYMAAGISGLTGIVGTFFVKDYLGLSAAFLAALGFWAGIPVGAQDAVRPSGRSPLALEKPARLFSARALIAVSLLIMVGLIGHREAMTAMMPAEAWYVLSVLLAPDRLRHPGRRGRCDDRRSGAAGRRAGTAVRRRADASSCIRRCRRWAAWPSSAAAFWSR